MRRHLIAISLFLLASVSAGAQSFLDHLQEGQGQGQGSVSVKQSDDISKLVNGKDKQKESALKTNKSDQSTGTQSPRPSASTPSTPSSSSSTSQPRESSASKNTQTAPEGQSASDREKERNRQRREDAKMKEEARQEALKDRDTYSSTATSSSRGSVKKVVRGGRRMEGYMVQVWAGGNTREDKQKAEQIGKEMKSAMPGLPVYVHFYSPRWACRIGNYRKQDDATALVKKLKKMGYRSSCVVKAMLVGRPYK